MPEKTQTPPPAYFLSLSLENVRSFGEKQTISFARPDGRPAQWTIILGDNGVGKTTVLKSLAALMPTEQPPPAGKYGPAYFSFRRPEWQLRRNKGEKPTFMYFTARGGALLSDPDWLEKASREIGMILEFLSPSSKLRSSNEFMDKDYPEAKTIICYGYGAGRSIGNSTLGQVQDMADTCISLFNDKADLLNPEEWFLQADYRVKSDSYDRRTKQNFIQLHTALLKVLEDVDMIKVSPATSGGNPEQGLQFHTPYGWVRLRDMSLGYQTLAVWLTDFASKLFIRYPDSPNPLEEPAIVLIDEIDLHLHPSWQRKLIGFLSGIFKNTQFIATAHSPLVVQAAGDQPSGANVVLLKREGDQTIVYQGEDLPDVRSWRLDQILSSELFDEVPAHSPDTEKKLQRRDALLAKSRLSASEKKELTELNEWDNMQPVGDSQPERKAADVLRELARKLGKQDLLD
ncbi:ATP-binding protein [Hymenobacter norwichensis]|nr:ATP-binding protein [Hymenobacter norwichensis]